jgi:hypothetical protein
LFVCLFVCFVCLFVCLFVLIVYALIFELFGDVRKPVAILDRARATVASSRW